MGYRRRRPLRRLDLLVLGASPDKLAAGADIPAIKGPGLTREQAELYYALRWRGEHGTLQPFEQAELERLRRLL